MKYFSLSEIFSSLFGAVSFGAAFGVILSALAIVFDNLTVIVKMPYRAFLIADKHGRMALAKQVTNGGASDSKVLASVRDFLFTASFGISFIFLVYLVSDGIPRLYVLFFSVAASLAVYKLFGVHVRRVFKAVFLWFFSLLTFLLALLLALPKRVIMRFVNPSLKNIKKIFAERSARLFTPFSKRLEKRGKK